MRQYTLEELNFLKEGYSKLRAKEIAQKLGRTENAIRMQAWLMGLKKPSRISSNPSPEKFTDIQLGYIAGLIDGEGTISIYVNRKGKRKKIFLSRGIWIRMTHFETISVIKELLKRNGFNPVYLCERHLNRKHRPTHAIYLYRSNEILSLLKVIELMLITKKEQARLMIKFCESREKRKYLPYTSEEWNIFKEIRNLNTKRDKNGNLFREYQLDPIINSVDKNE